jgi:hypothetical protein
MVLKWGWDRKWRGKEKGGGEKRVLVVEGMSEAFGVARAAIRHRRIVLQNSSNLHKTSLLQGASPSDAIV